MLLSIPGWWEAMCSGFSLGEEAMLDAVLICQPQNIITTLVALAPVSDVPFLPSGAWSPGLATAVGRIAQAQRWIRHHPDLFYSSIVDAFSDDLQGTHLLQSLIHFGPTVIRPDFLIIIGRRDSVDEKGRFSFHDSVGRVALLSYDSILRGLFRGDFRRTLAAPVLVQALIIKPSAHCVLSISAPCIEKVSALLRESLVPSRAEISIELVGLEVSLRGQCEGAGRQHDEYVWNHTDVQQAGMHITNTWQSNWAWSDWIYPERDNSRSNAEAPNQEFAVMLRAPGLRRSLKADLVITAAIYREVRAELQEWAVRH
jgi:hypothetical protein